MTNCTVVSWLEFWYKKGTLGKKLRNVNSLWDYFSNDIIILIHLLWQIYLLNFCKPRNLLKENVYYKEKQTKRCVNFYIRHNFKLESLNPHNIIFLISKDCRENTFQK